MNLTNFFIRICPCVALIIGALTLPLHGQTTSAPATTQVAPGTSASMGPGKATDPKPHKILASALTPQTRKTLQQAMNSAPDPTANK